MRILLLVLLLAATCSSPSPLSHDAQAIPRPPSAPTVDRSARRVVVARLVRGTQGFFACGVLAFVGVYVYQVVSVKQGPPLAGEIVVDVLCPDFYGNADTFQAGRLHRLTLGPAQSEYALTEAPPSPAETAPRFEAIRVTAL
jgi:hypothetical protein